MTIQHDVLANTGCDLVPAVQPWGPGWYLVAVNDRVEAGPFSTILDAALAVVWLHEIGHGVHPAPWLARWSGTGLIVGSRVRDRSDLRA